MRTIIINNPGPQGATGPQGTVGPSGSTQPFSNISGSIWATTSSLEVSGSFTVSGSSTFTNIGPAVFSGSVNATSGVTMSSAVVSGDVTVLGTASINVLQINTTINSTGSNTLGDSASDTQTLYGSVIIPTGSLTVSGAAQITGNINLPNQYQYIGMGINDAIRFANGEVRVSTSTTTGNFSVYSPSYGLTAFRVIANGNTLIGTTADSGYKLNVSGSVIIRGSGSTSATDALVVQNNIGTNLLTIKNANDSGAYNLYAPGGGRFGQMEIVDTSIGAGGGANVFFPYNRILFGGNTGTNASAQVQIDSTTRGFLPPRTNTTASISSPAQGLMTYLTGSTNEGLYYYNSGSQTGWHKLLTSTGSQSVSGSLTVNDTITIPGATAATKIILSGTNVQLGLLGDGQYIQQAFIQGTGITGNTIRTNNLTTDNNAYLVKFQAGTTDRAVITQLGNVGIGTTTPTSQLHISASDVSSAYSFLVQNSSGQTLISSQNNRTVNINATNAVSGDTNIGTTNGVIYFNTGYGNSLSGNAFQFYSGGAPSTIQGFYTNPGLAIGYSQTTVNPNPGTALAIRGTVTTSGSGVLFVTGSSTTKLLGIASETNANILVVSGSGLVGIGTATPGATLEVNGAVKTTTLFTANWSYDGASNTKTIQTQGAVAGDKLTLADLNGYTGTGNQNLFVVGNTGFNPSSGTGTFNIINLIASISQSGTATGITRGIYVNPTVTSAANYRAIETTSGNVLFQSGSTPLMLVSSSGVVSVGLSGSAYGSTGTSNGKLTINNTSGNNGLAIRTGETGYQLGIKTTVNDNIGTEFVWFDGATFTFLQHGGAIGTRLGPSGYAQFRANFYSPDSTATIHTGASNAERLRVTNTGLVGIGTSTPSASLHISSSNAVLFEIDSPTVNNILYVSGSGNVGINTTGSSAYNLDVNGTTRVTGAGSTGSTFALTVRNSSGTLGLTVRDDGTVYNRFINTTQLSQDGAGNAGYIQGNLCIGEVAYAGASAILDVRSTTRGFLPPRMTNAQRVAISTPAVGLMVYCTDATEGLYIYKSTGWTFIV